MEHALDGEGDRKFHVPHMAYVVYIFIYVCYMFITPENAWEILQTHIKKEMAVLENSP